MTLPDPEAAINAAGPWTHRDVSANGSRFHVVDAGTGPAVVLLHGFPMFWWTWRRQVTALLQSGKKMVGVCFGHQLIALCMGAPVGRAPQGWGAGRMTYDWHRPDLPHQADRTQIALLASHQDQVLELPPGATLVASSDFCPVAAFTVGDAVFCIQPHPEFEESLSAHLIDKRRDMLGEEKYQASRASLEHGHEGEDVARMVVAFLEGTRPAP